MKKMFLPFAVLACFYSSLAVTCAAQDVTGLANAIQAALDTSTVAVSVTATQGDGTTCSINKLAGTVIAFALKCQTSDGKTQSTSQIIRSTSAVPWTTTFGLGDVMFLLAFNPTTAAVPEGSLGSIAISSLGWSYTTNIRTNGSISGQTAPVVGQISWP